MMLFSVFFGFLSWFACLNKLQKKKSDHSSNITSQTSNTFKLKFNQPPKMSKLNLEFGRTHPRKVRTLNLYLAKYRSLNLFELMFGYTNRITPTTLRKFSNSKTHNCIQPHSMVAKIKVRIL